MGGAKVQKGWNTGTLFPESKWVDRKMLGKTEKYVWEFKLY